jgi:hypothetical protein
MDDKDRVYVDRAVQTDGTDSLCHVSYSNTEIHSLPTASEITDLKTRHLTPKKPFPLPYNRPSESYSSSARISSLPETPSLILVQETNRIASMPEYQLRPANPTSSEETISEYFESSASYDSSRISSGSTHIRRSLRSVAPQTPSPPSSPESVMIIGNDVQVPVSFLRQKNQSDSPFEEDDGMLSRLLFILFPHIIQVGSLGQVLRLDQYLRSMAPFLFLMPDAPRKSPQIYLL